MIPIIQRLDLSGNRLTIFPDDLPLLYLLEELLLAGNDIEVIPKEISKMKNLSKLDLSDNMIRELPETLAKTPLLKNLDLTDNQIMSWPTNFAKLQNKCNVSDCRIISHLSFFIHFFLQLFSAQIKMIKNVCKLRTFLSV